MYVTELFISLLEKETPIKWRKRVEIFIVNDEGKLILGEKKDIGIIAPGGGIENLTVENAAKKEALEELGVNIKNIKILTKKPYRVDWFDLKEKGEELTDKVLERMKNFRGSETYLCVADFDKNDKKLYGDDNDTIKRRILSIDEFIEECEKKKSSYELDKGFYDFRIDALRRIK